MRVQRIEIVFSSDGAGWILLGVDSGTWTVGDGFDVQLSVGGVVRVTKSMVEIAHTDTPPGGAEAGAVLLLETDAGTITGRGSTSGRFSVTAGGARVELDSAPSVSDEGIVSGGEGERTFALPLTQQTNG